MTFKLLFTDEATDNLNELRSLSHHKKHLKSIEKALGYLETNPRHPSLNTHKFSSLIGENGEEIFEAYAENNTPGAYRIFWYYGPNKKDITIIAITAHP